MVNIIITRGSKSVGSYKTIHHSVQQQWKGLLPHTRPTSQPNQLLTHIRHPSDPLIAFSTHTHTRALALLVHAHRMHDFYICAPLWTAAAVLAGGVALIYAKCRVCVCLCVQETNKIHTRAAAIVQSVGASSRAVEIAPITVHTCVHLCYWRAGRACAANCTFLRSCISYLCECVPMCKSYVLNGFVVCVCV